MGFPVPRDEASRLAALRELDILDTDAEGLYDDVVRLAATITGAPIALVTFIDADREWSKARIGLTTAEVPREASFCARTIVAPGGVLVVPDAAADVAWIENEQVTGPPHLRFYAGAAIRTEDGHALGAVCVADRAPRRLAPEAIEALRLLARQTAAHLELRRQTRRLSEANVELRRVAVEDALTGLANRTLLLDRLSLALRQRRRGAGPLGVLFCDLDGFKGINDRLGHEAGDGVLRLVAERLALAARDSDTVARTAADEFVVLCPDLSDPNDLPQISRRLAAAAARPVSLGTEEVVPRLSIGAVLAEATDDPASVLRRAEDAMADAKRRAFARP